MKATIVEIGIPKIDKRRAVNPHFDQESVHNVTKAYITLPTYTILVVCYLVLLLDPLLITTECLSKELEIK
jgi:hypothetical protein